MRYLTTVPLSVLLAFGLTACGNDEPSPDEVEKVVAEAIESAFPETNLDNFVSCDEFFERMPVPPAEINCANDEKGTVEIGVAIDCEDGRTFIWTGTVMGYAGEPGEADDSAADNPRRAELQRECMSTDW